jgi:mannose-1-phosphate guanylyltransferase/mannose-6-phosphate isomerase
MDTDAHILPVVLCGGSGTRLWPLSRKAVPKQFATLFANESLLQLTLRRLKHFNSHLFAVGNEDHRFLIHEAFERELISSTIILEPSQKNTAAAMALAALTADPNQLLLFSPSDHYIGDSQAFYELIQSGREAAESGYWVTFGISPSYPSSAYGYIRASREDPLGERNHSNALSEMFRVNQFVEKPSTEVAERFLLQGSYYWNAGIFLVSAKACLDSLARLAPDILDSCKNAIQFSSQDGVFIRPDRSLFNDCRSESIDYAVLEKLEDLVMLPFHGSWSDVGSWKSVSELYDADINGNRIVGQGHAIESSGTFIHAESRPIVAVGTENILIVDTPDATLVVNVNHSERVKDAVNLLESKGVLEAVTHRQVIRPWGSFDSIDRGERFQVKRITVKPMSRLSLQMHHHRAEHWIVVRGIARVTCGDQVFDLNENESTYIPCGTKHRLENLQDFTLEIIEVQSGDYLGEDDIVRFEDHYGRT